MADLGRHLDRAHENKEFDELADSPVDALEGVSANDAAALKQAFNITTIRQLAESKFVLRAQAITNLADAANARRAGEEVRRFRESSPPLPSPKVLEDIARRHEEFLDSLDVEYGPPTREDAKRAEQLIQKLAAGG